jgi:hypothetical protein
MNVQIVSPTATVTTTETPQREGVLSLQSPPETSEMSGEQRRIQWDDSVIGKKTLSILQR